MSINLEPKRSIYTKATIAEEFSINVDRINRAVRAGELPKVTSEGGRTAHVLASDVKAWLESLFKVAS